jgi:hypothetical protein
MLNFALMAILLSDANPGIVVHAPTSLRERIERELGDAQAARDTRIDIRMYGTVNAPETMRIDRSGTLVIGSGEVSLKCLIEITRNGRLVDAILVSAEGRDETTALSALCGKITARLSPWLRHAGH